MPHEHVTRRLAAILAADVAGYSRMMEEDEASTISAIRKVWSETFQPIVAFHHGRIFKLMGDGALIEFASVVEAVECAVQVQAALAQGNLVAERPISCRIGIHVGDVVLEGDDVFGDGVNIAARLESQAPAGGILISDLAHSQVAGKVSISFASSGELRLKNIRQPVRGWRWQPGETRPDLPTTGFSVPLPSEHPSLAVLPFTVLGSDPEQEFFADGLVDDIIATLAKLSGLSVIARHSSFAYKGRTIDVRQVAHELGVRYVLEGSIRKSADRLRITTQLVDATTGVHVWAERFDRRMEDMFAVQDEITLRLATEMQVKLTEGEQARIRYTTTSNVEAWTLWIEGLHYERAPKTRETHLRTRHCWEKALALDPDSAVLAGLIGVSYFADARHGWTGEDRDSALAKADLYIARSLGLDPTTPDAHRGLCGVQLLRRQFTDAAHTARRAAQFGPSVTDVLAFSGFVLTCCGFAREAIGHVEKAVALCPNYSPWHLGVLGNAYRLAGRSENAMSAFRAYHARSPGYGLADMVMVQDQAGLLDEARATANQLLTFRPGFNVAYWRSTQFRVDEEQLAADEESLRRSGVPEQ